MRRWLAFVSCLVLAGAAHAQEIRGGYLGVGYGLFSYDEASNESGIFISDTAGAYRLLGGYQLNSNYAIEIGWSKSGDLSESFGTLAEIEVEYEAATLRGIAYAPFSEISLFGGLGYYDATAETLVVINTDEGTQRFPGERDDSGFTLIGGLQFDLSRFAIRAEYEWFNTSGNTDASTMNVGVLFRF